MGYCFISGYCGACGEFIPVFNPVRVPSLTINGEKEPICLSCFTRWNQIHRIDKGLEPIPLAEDAYAACEESEIY